ncbi:MAG: ABC transporter permease, partial [Blastocatellia bacterium]
MLPRIKQGLRALMHKQKMEKDLDEEIGYHLAKAIQQNIARGMTPDEARRAARAGFGGIDQQKEECRDARGARLLEDLFRDLQLGTRMLLKYRGLTLVIVLMLGLGIGANTAIFSLLNTLLTRVLPVNSPRELVFVQWSGSDGDIEHTFSYPAFERFRDANHSFAGLFAVDNSRVNATIQGEPEMTWGDFVSGSYFDVLGVTAALGRTFSADDDKPGQRPVAVISYAYWERRFSRDPAVIGRTIYLGKIPFTLI